MRSIPRLDSREKERLEPIPGMPPDLIDLPSMCPFAPRCSYARETCLTAKPPLLEVSPGHLSACWRFDQVSLSRRPLAEAVR